MEFVNLHGKPITIAPGAAAPKRSSKPPLDSYHKGWRAVGFSPQHIEEARVAYEAARAKAAESGRSMLAWDEDRYIRQTKPHPIRSKPYSTEEAADQACDLARRAGWKGCTSIPVAKGK